MSEPAVPRCKASPRPPLHASPDQNPDAGRDDFYEHLVQVCLLLLLQDDPASSGKLRDGLRPLGFERTTADVEAALDVLAADALVGSTQERSADGRVSGAYAMTADGRKWLRSATIELRRTEVVLGGFLARCGERLLSRV